MADNLSVHHINHVGLESDGFDVLKCSLNEYTIFNVKFRRLVRTLTYFGSDHYFYLKLKKKNKTVTSSMR